MNVGESICKEESPDVCSLSSPPGLLLHKQPISLQAGYQRRADGYPICHSYYRETPVPPPSTTSPSVRRLREEGAIEFLHRWEDLLGGLCRSGFVIEDLIEPLHAKPDAMANSFADRATFVPPYVRIKAKRTGAESTTRKRLIIT